MADETAQPPAEQAPAIKDVNLNITTAKGADGIMYPVLQISMIFEPGRAAETGAALAQALATADAACLTANAASGLVLPDTVGKLFVPITQPNGHTRG